MWTNGWSRRRRSTRHVLGWLVLVATLGGAGAQVAPVLAEDLPVGSDEDIVAPQVTSLAIDPLGVDVTDGVNKTFKATLTATDDLSGVSSISAWYGPPSPTSRQYISFAFTRTAGDAKNGTYSGTYTATPLQHNGTYRFSHLEVRDTVGNYRTYPVSDHPGPDALSVKSTADVVPPVATGLRISPNPLDVRESRQQATIEVDVTDDASGVASVQGSFTSPSGRQAAVFLAVPVPGQPGLARGQAWVAQYSEPGDWQLTWLCSYDRARNEQCFGTYTTPKVGEVFPTPLSVLSDPVDGVRPEIPAYRFSPSAIDVTTGPAMVTVDFDVADDLSGVQFASAMFTSPRTAGASPEVIQRMAFAYAPSIYSLVQGPDGTFTQVEDDSKRLLSGTVSGRAVFPQYDRFGNWTLSSVCVVDQVNWQRCYSPFTTPPVGSLGPTDLVVKWNRAPVVQVTGVTESSYEEGSEPAPGCAVTDVEDGEVTGVEPTIERDGDTVTVTCTYQDDGIDGGQHRQTGTATATYTIARPAGPTLRGVPTTEPNAAGWYNGDVTIRWTATEGGAPIDPEAVPDDDVITTEGTDQTTSASVTDQAGRSASATSAPPVDLDKTAPTVGAPSFSPNPVPAGQVSAVSAAAADNLSGVVSGEYFIGADPGVGNGVVMALADGRLAATLGSDLAPGLHTVGIRAVDRAGNWSHVASADLVVSYVTGAFVTGGGHIESPAGALVAEPAQTGRATFGFVSRYKKGTTVPTGNTQFRFHAGGLDFSSTRYDWLVVAGAKAQFKGQGTVNGGAGYSFLLTATDGHLGGGGGSDRFRIKIWNAAGVVYDNALGADDAAAGLAIAGGSVVIH